MKIRISDSKHFTHTLALVALLAILLAAPRSRAADATWITNANGDWTNSTNWSGGNIPGAANSTSNGDTATFGVALTAPSTNTIDANRNIGGITFNHTTSGTNGYSLSGNLLLSDGGTIQSVSTNTPSGDRIDRLGNTVYIQGAAGSATFKNNSTSSRVRLIINAVEGTAITNNTATLYLGGANTGANNIGSTIKDGGNGGKLAVVKNDSGLWRLTAAGSTYSGGTTLNAGTLGYAPTTSVSNTVFGTGVLTINGGTLQHVDDNSRTITNAITVGGNFTFAARSAATTTFSGNVNLGGATRTITAGGLANSQTILSGVISNGGLTKAGAETLTLQGDNTYTGGTTVSAGTLILDTSSGAALGSTASVTVATNATLLISRSDQVNNSASITLSGGTIKRASGASETFGDLNLTSASTLDYGSGTAGTLAFGTYTPSSLLTVNNFFEGNKLVFSGDMSSTITDTSYFKFSGAFTTNYSGGLFTITAIPEPTTCAAAVGLIGLMLWPMRRRFLSQSDPMKARGFEVV